MRLWQGSRIVISLVLVLAHRTGADTGSRVQELINSPGYEAAHWGLLVVDAETGESVYELNADQLYGLASVTKLFTCAAALNELGADFRFQTPVVRDGEVDENGTLLGNLILIAQGDLCLGGRTDADGSLLFRDQDHTYAGGYDAELVPRDPLGGLDHLAREVHAAGIRLIQGDIVIDDRLFELAESTGSGPKRVVPILVNDNLVDVVVAPAEEPGELAAVRTVPPSIYYSMDARVETVAEGQPLRVSVHPEGSRRFSVRGQIPIGHKEVLKVYEVQEPSAFARALFIEKLRERGIEVSASPLGENRADRLPPLKEVSAMPKVAEYTSPTFREYLKVILKVSHNLYASTLPMLLASRHGERTLSEGLRRQGAILESLGIVPGTVSFGGGAGGDRADLASPRATVALLRAMARHPDGPAFEAALPILGRDGTAAQHVDADSPVRGHVRAKTGSYYVTDRLTGRTVLTSKALAGYMETASGRSLVFAFFVNNVPPGSEDREASAISLVAGQLLGALCEVFYSASESDEDVP
ncbi:D-alanyl-D-alanine carboxypeptidase/D-alanyl-D-alanine-endopeptidase [soil metagenome]